MVEPTIPVSLRIAAVIVAGGSGTRMGAARGARKQYLDLAGEPVLSWAVRAFAEHPAISQVVVVLPADDAHAPPRWLKALGVDVAAGGVRRSDSVRNGLEAIAGDTDLVLVHDGARPFVSEGLIDRVIGHAAEGAAIPALRATDTLKEVDSEGYVVGTIDRTHVWLAQTPQGFLFPVLLAGHRRASEEDWEITDDAAVCERMGARIRIVQGDPGNLKITHPFDLEIARAIAASRGSRAVPGTSLDSATNG